MEPSVALLALGSFIGAMLVIERVGSWLAGLIVAFKQPPSDANQQRSLGPIAQLFLHSGPWALAIALSAAYYVAIAARPAHIWAMVGGAALGLAFVTIAAVRALWQQRSGRPHDLPLTPERLLTLRRRFFWLNTLLFAIALPAGIAFTTAGEFKPEVLLLLSLVGGALAGWAWSWVMWQWVGEALKVREQARIRRTQDNAV